MLQKEIKVVNKKGVYYLLADGRKQLKFKPWLGDSFSFLYDYIMKNSIFPKKFAADIERHYAILREELLEMHGKNVLELASGSGSAINFLPPDNQYTGTDISPGLLRQAVKNFHKAGVTIADFYVTKAEQLPFEDESFDLVLCVLSFNFFSDGTSVLREVRRVLSKSGLFLCVVPVPERKKTGSIIRGTLYTEKELAAICREDGFTYEAIPTQNGALLYFKAHRQ